MNNEFDEELDELVELENYDSNSFNNNKNLKQEFLKNQIKTKTDQIRQQRNNVNHNQNATNRLKQRNANTLGKKVELRNSTSSNNEENNLENNKNAEKQNTKLNPLDKLKKTEKNVTKKAGDATKDAAKKAGNAVAKGIASGIKFLALNPATAPFFWAGVLLVILILLIPILWAAFDGGSNGSGGSDFGCAEVNTDSMISLTHTKLSRNDFVNSCEQTRFSGKCGIIYDISVKNNFNPEMVVIRAIAEGYSPGSSRNNYWGIGCYNGAGLSACHSYSSFENGVLAFIKNVSQYETVEQMMGKYAYIGDNWYNPGDSANGGCYYYPYIKKYMSSTRSTQVASACSAGRACRGIACEPTNPEDQLAYSKWQVSHMVEHGNSVFGSVTGGKMGSTDSCNSEESMASPTGIPDKLDDLKNRYYFNYDMNEYINVELQMSSHPFGQCVWYAKHRAMDIINSSKLSLEEKEKRINFLKSFYMNSLGNGVNVVDSLTAFKRTTNIDEVKAPAVISWWTGEYGHVGILEEITNENGTKMYHVTETGRAKRGNPRAWFYVPEVRNDPSSIWTTVNFHTAMYGGTGGLSSGWNGYRFKNAAMLLE